MPTVPYNLINNYSQGASPDALDLDRRADILASQLPIALEAQGAGVLASPDASSLLVLSSGNGTFVVARGAALIRNEQGYLVAATLPAETPVPAYTGDGAYLVYVALQTPTAGNTQDSLRGAPLQILAESVDAEAVASALLLAQIGADGTITDLRDLDVRGFGWLFGNGRVAGLDTTIGAPSVVTGVLQITLPAGAEYYVTGKHLVLSDDVLLDVPPSSTVWGVLSLDNNGEPQVLDWRSSKPNGGAGCIGKVVSDATHVLSIDATDEDIIQPEWVKQTRLKALIGGGSTGTGTGIDPTDITNLQAAIANLTNRMVALEGTSAIGVSSLMTFDERIDAEQMAQNRALVALNPLFAQDAPESILWDGVTGNGENVSPSGTQPNVNAGGNEPIGG